MRPGRSLEDFFTRGLCAEFGRFWERFEVVNEQHVHYFLRIKAA